MPFAPSSPVTGATMTGLTNPTYTLVEDKSPTPYSKQYAVTALGGTQTGVDTHGVSNPFTITMHRPANFRQVGVANPVTGIINNIPNNVTKVIVRKGVEPASGQPNRLASAELKISVPAGADENDEVSVRAMLSLLFGAVWAESDDTADVPTDGIL